MTPDVTARPAPAQGLWHGLRSMFSTNDQTSAYAPVAVDRSDKELGLWRGQRPHNCVTCGGVMGTFAGMIVFTSLMVSRSNETATANSTIFYVISLLLFLICALSSVVAVQRRDKRAAIAFTGIVVVLCVVMFSFMIADAADPMCEDNVIYLFRCNPGEKQSALRLVTQDACIIAVLVIFATASVKLYGRLRIDEMHRARQMPPEGTRQNVELDDSV
jgi:hypothetical protein